MFTETYQDFAENKHIKLFDGKISNLRPVSGSFARQSGLFKVLGTMIAHSITMDGLVFHISASFVMCTLRKGSKRPWNTLT